MKKILTICACLVAGAAMAQTTPIEISDRAGLEAIANNLTGSYILTADIDLGGNYDTETNLWTPIAAPVNEDDTRSFQGTLDGAGHTISGLAVKTSSTSATYVGLFGRIASTGVVKNLNVSGTLGTNGGSDASNGNIGTIAGVNHGTIQNCSSSATLYVFAADTDAGGIVGENRGSIQNTSYTGTLEFGSYSADKIGGIVGDNETSGLLCGCTKKGTPISTETAGTTVSGQIFGQNNGSLVEGTTVKFVGRTLYKDDDWNTICLPFDVTIAGSILAGATVKELDVTTKETSTPDVYKTRVYKNNDDAFYTLNLEFADVEKIKAGKPYLIKWATGTHIDNPEFTGVDMNTYSESLVAVTSADGRVTFQGLLSAKDIAATGDNTMLFLGASNTLYYPNDAMTIGANRAYFQLNNGFTFGEPNAGVRSFNLNFGEEEITGVESVDDSQLSTLNSQLSEWYTLTGVKLDGKPTAPGIYICGGRRVVIK